MGQLNSIARSEWLPNWAQGEHIAIIGPTGTGKTTIARELLAQREYVCALAVKRHDDVLDTFLPEYKIIDKWPPLYSQHKVIFWPKPEGIRDQGTQAERLYSALNQMYRNGCWCIYFDEAGYIAGNLGMSEALGVLLNQGRSSHLSVVASMTRPTSMVARVPREALNQPRHKLIFRYDNEDEIKACARIADVGWREMKNAMAQLRYYRAKNGTQYSDFLYCTQGKSFEIIRNT